MGEAQTYFERGGRLGKKGGVVAWVVRKKCGVGGALTLHLQGEVKKLSAIRPGDLGEGRKRDVVFHQGGD